MSMFSPFFGYSGNGYIIEHAQVGLYNGVSGSVGNRPLQEDRAVLKD